MISPGAKNTENKIIAFLQSRISIKEGSGTDPRCSSRAVPPTAADCALSGFGFAALRPGVPKALP